MFYLSDISKTIPSIKVRQTLLQVYRIVTSSCEELRPSVTDVIFFYFIIRKKSLYLVTSYKFTKESEVHQALYNKIE